MNKPWYQSKAVLSGVLLIATAVVTVGQAYANGAVVDWASFITTASQGLGILGIRVAMK